MVRELAGSRAFLLLFLIVLVALVGSSPVFGDDGDNITLIKIGPGQPVSSGCPGDLINVDGYFGHNYKGGETIELSSSPGGLIAAGHVQSPYVGSRDDSGTEIDCFFEVSESACAVPYTVTATLMTDGEVVGSASASYTVGTDECPDVPPCAAAVGGCVQPVNTLALMSPWLAVIGLVGCIATVVVVAKKRFGS